ncbi:HPr family phosphocarrier protein [bacterium]|nr:HPr family phosphocarrier protein [bacterium]
MLKSDVIIMNKLGIHARPASKLVKITSLGKSEVFLLHDNQRVNAKSILGVMLLQAVQGSRVTIEVNGIDEEEVLRQIIELIERKFDEE